MTVEAGHPRFDGLVVILPIRFLNLIRLDQTSIEKARKKNCRHKHSCEYVGEPFLSTNLVVVKAVVAMRTYPLGNDWLFEVTCV